MKQGDRMSTMHKTTENNFKDRINLYSYKKISTFTEQKFRGVTIM